MHDHRFLVLGGVAGLLAISYGIVSRLPGGHSEFNDVAWIALCLPAVIYVAWWLRSPGLSRDDSAPSIGEAIDANVPQVDTERRSSADAFRVRRAEQTLEQRQQYLESIRQPEAMEERPAAFRRKAAE